MNMAHRPIVIDGAGVYGSVEGAGGVEPGPPNDHGGCGACIHQVVVPTAPPHPGTRDKDAVRQCVLIERRVPKPHTSQHWVLRHFMVRAKEALVNIAVCIIYIYMCVYVCGTYARCFLIFVLFSCVLVLSGCSLRRFSTLELLEPVLQ